MTIMAVEGVVENGQIRFRDPVTLPEHAKVYVVISDVASVTRARVASPKLVHPEHAVDFVKQVVEVSADASL